MNNWDKDEEDQFSPKLSKEKLLKGGAMLLSHLGSSMTAEQSLVKLMKAGFTRDECDEIAETVAVFTKHQSGDHSRCRKDCVERTKISKERPEYKEKIELIKNFELLCVKCGCQKFGKSFTIKELEKYNKRCPDCRHPIHSSLMMAIDKHFGDKMEQEMVDIYKIGFDDLKID